MESGRAEELLRLGSAILPAKILSRLIGVRSKQLYKMRKRLGVEISIAESKRIMSSFWKKLPDIGELPLTLEERRLVRELRQTWIYRSKGDLARKDNIYDVIIRCVRRIPTTGIAAALGMSRQRVLEYQSELDLEIGRSERKAIEHSYASSPKCPMPKFISADERCRLKEHWRGARAKYKQARARALQKSLAILAANLVRMEELKANMLGLDPGIELRPCSGNCKKCWPRAKPFFIPNFRSPDRLGDRCKYCDFEHRIRVRHDGTKRKNRKRGRMLTAQAEARAKAIVGKYWRVIPASIFARFFNVSPNTIERYRVDLGISIPRTEYHRIFWRWYFRDDMPHFDFLSEDELARLFTLTALWRKIIAKRFARDEELEKTLKEERVRYRAQAWHGPGTEPVHEVKCIRCSAEYPPIPAFFRFVGKKQRPVCRVCIDYENAVTRQKLMRRRYKPT